MDAIGIDIGSTNVKGVLVDDTGARRAVASRALRWERHGVRAELDADDLWGAVRALFGDLAAAADRGLAEVGIVGICGQYSSIVPVDGEGRPVAPMRLYLDTRGTRHCQALLEHHPDAFMTWIERHPVPPVGGGLALGHLLAFQHDHPDIHAATATYLEPVDYITSRLTARATATQGSMFAGQLVDNRTLGVTAYDPELVALAGIDAAKLPTLVAPDAVLGEVRADVAKGVGLPGGVAVAAGMTDSHAAALATGAHRPGRVGMAVGTTGVVLDTTDTLAVDLDHEVLAMPGVRAGEYLVWAENGLAGRAVEQVLERFVHATDPLGSHGAADPFTGFEAALAASAPGAGGAMFLPWLSGSMAPQADGTVRGGFVGVSLDTERVDLVRAAAEGVAHNLRWVLGPVEALAGAPATEVVLTGGAARSPGWAQVLADVLDRPVRTLAEPQLAGATAMAGWARLVVGGSGGAAAVDGWADGGAADGGAADVDDRPGLGTRWADRYQPDRGATAIHDAAHEQFVATFDALRPLRLGQP